MSKKLDSKQLNIANSEIAFKNSEIERLVEELFIINKKFVHQNSEIVRLTDALLLANDELVFVNSERQKRAEELIIANKELVYQNSEKEKRANELLIANKKLAFENVEKEKRATELAVANKELAFQNREKEKRAGELKIANEKLAYEESEKVKRVAELEIANKELKLQNLEIQKLTNELISTNKEIIFQNNEKDKRANELILANNDLVYQNSEIEKLAAELKITNKELAYQNSEKEKRTSELELANKKLISQNSEKEKIAAELKIAHDELAHQNSEKEKRAADLILAIEELSYQNLEKEKRAKELILANKELAFLNKDHHALFASIVNSSEDAILSLSLEGIIASWNNGAEKIFGYNATEITGKSILTFIPQSLHDGEREILKNIREGKTVEHFNTERLRKDGTLFYASITISAIKNYKGETVGVSKILRDISDTKILEDDKKSLAKRFLLATKSANMAIWDWNLEYNTVLWDDAMFSLYRIAPNNFDFTYNGWISRTHPDDRQKVESDLQLALSNKKEFDCEFRIVCDDLSIHYVKATGIVERDDSGIARHMIGTILDITERKKAEIKLFENENYLRTILDSEPECVKVLNRKGELLSMNPAGLAMIEADNEQQVLGCRMTDLVNKKYLASFNQLSKEIFKGNPGNLEFEITGLKGGCRWLETHAVPLKDATGKIVKLLGVTRDITERKKAEEQLKLFASVVTNTTDSVVITEAEPLNEPGPRILYVNDAFTKMTGYSVNEVIGKTPRILQGPKTDKDELKKLSEAIRKWQPYETTLINYKKNGEEFWINFALTPVANEKGCYTHWISIERDITEQKLAEIKLSALVKELADYKFALDQSSIVAVTDQKGIIKYVNDNFLTISKFSRDELIGQDHKIINSGYHDRTFIQNLWVTIANGRIWKGELKNKAKDGSIYWVNTTIVPFLNNEGKPYQYIAIRNDITERNKYQNTIEAQNEKLRDIAWTQSHILRAPLARMLGLLNLMEMDSFKSDELPQLMSHFKNSLHELDDVIIATEQKSQALGF